MKAWLKGGIIGAVIGFILTLFNGFIWYLALAQEAGKVTISPYLWASLGIIFKITSPIVLLPIYLSRFFTPLVFLTPIFSVGVLFIIGSLIGWIIGKIKSRA